jgi:beta-galactosidase/beta-glucuronidase
LVHLPLSVTDDRYKAWLDLMVDGNQNMVRVWAGGIYEADVFYEYCDQVGLLVWQDFMFGCGQYPAHDKFVASVKEEAEQAVTRLRDHPSVVIFVSIGTLIGWVWTGADADLLACRPGTTRTTRLRSSLGSSSTTLTRRPTSGRRTSQRELCHLMPRLDPEADAAQLSPGGTSTSEP